MTRTPQCFRLPVIRDTRVIVLTVVLAATSFAPLWGRGVGSGDRARAGQQAAGIGTIAGRVTEADGTTPIAAAVVSLEVSRGARGALEDDRVLTDGDGRFVFTKTPAGTYALEAEKPGYLVGALGRHRPNGPSLPVTITSGTHDTTLSLILWRPAVLAGRVVDEAGEPLVDVAVRAARVGFVAGHRQMNLVAKTRSDDRGLYRFSSLTAGDYVVVVIATVTSEPTSYAGAIRAEGWFPEAPSYLQTMTTLGAAPLVENDPVTGLSGIRGVLASSELGIATTPPADGAWLAYPTTYAPTATTLSSATVVRASSGQVETLPDLALRLTATYQVSGVVTGPDGPAAYYAVHLLAADQAEAPLIDTATAVTDVSGAFTFFGVPPGSYVARVIRVPVPEGVRGNTPSNGGDSDRWVTLLGGAGVPSEPLLWATQPVIVAERNIRNLTLTLRSGARVTGRAEFRGTASPPSSSQLTAVTVNLEPAGGAPARLAQQTFPGRFGPDGQFATPSTWPGPYLLRASAPAGWTFVGATYQGHDISETPFDLTSDIDTVFITYTDRPPTEVSGTVAPAAGDSAAGCAVLLFPADPAEWIDYGTTSRRVRMVTVGLDGSYSVPSPPAGDYNLVAIPDEQADNWQDPRFLEKVAGLADRIVVIDGRPLVHVLHVRRVS